MKRDIVDATKGADFRRPRTTEGPDAAREHFFHGFTKLHRDISLIRKPTIAMIASPAVGSGMDMPTLRYPPRPGIRGSSAITIGTTPEMEAARLRRWLGWGEP
jgi:hypothetical protein